MVWSNLYLGECTALSLIQALDTRFRRLPLASMQLDYNELHIRTFKVQTAEGLLAERE